MYWIVSVTCTSISLVALGLVARAVCSKAKASLGKRGTLSFSVMPVLFADGVFSISYLCYHAHNLRTGGDGNRGLGCRVSAFFGVWAVLMSLLSMVTLAYAPWRAVKTAAALRKYQGPSQADLAALMFAEGLWAGACAGLGVYRGSYGTNRGLYCSVEDWGDPVVAMPILLTWVGSAGAAFYFFYDTLSTLRRRRRAAVPDSPHADAAVRDTTILGLGFFLNVLLYWGLMIASLVISLLAKVSPFFPDGLSVEFEMAAGASGKLKPIADALVILQIRAVRESRLVSGLFRSFWDAGHNIRLASRRFQHHVQTRATASRARSSFSDRDDDEDDEDDGHDPDDHGVGHVFAHRQISSLDIGDIDYGVYDGS